VIVLEKRRHHAASNLLIGPPGFGWSESGPGGGKMGGLSPIAHRERFHPRPSPKVLHADTYGFSPAKERWRLHIHGAHEASLAELSLCLHVSRPLAGSCTGRCQRRSETGPTSPRTSFNPPVETFAEGPPVSSANGRSTSFCPELAHLFARPGSSSAAKPLFKAASCVKLP